MPAAEPPLASAVTPERCDLAWSVTWTLQRGAQRDVLGVSLGDAFGDIAVARQLLATGTPLGDAAVRLVACDQAPPSGRGTTTGPLEDGDEPPIAAATPVRAEAELSPDLGFPARAMPSVVLTSTAGPGAAVFAWRGILLRWPTEGCLLLASAPCEPMIKSDDATWRVTAEVTLL